MIHISLFDWGEIPQASWIQSGATEKNVICKQPNKGVFKTVENSAPDTFLPTTGHQQSNIKFVELFWFLRPVENQKRENELDLVTLSLNLNFGNARFNGYFNAHNLIHGSGLFLQSEALTINAAVYPAGIFNILHLENRGSYSPVEQLFVGYSPGINPWHDDLPTTLFEKSNDCVRVTFTRKTGESYFYIFEGKQLLMLNYACQFIISNGPSLVATAKFS